MLYEVITISGLVLPNERFGEYLPVLPIAYEVFTDGLRDQAVNAVRNSVEALSCRQFLERSLQALHSGADDFVITSYSIHYTKLYDL